MDSLSLPLSPVAAGLLLLLSLSLALLCGPRRLFSRRRRLLVCRRLARRCTTPFPSLLVVILAAFPALAHLAEGTGLSAPDGGPPSFLGLLFSSLLQVLLYGGAVVTTLAISDRDHPDDGLPDSTDPGANPEAKALPLSEACQKGLLHGALGLVAIHSATFLAASLLAAAGLATPPQPVVGWLASPATSPLLKATLILQSVLVAPVLEESLFRFALLPSLAGATGSVPRSILYSSLLFSLLHGSLTGIVPLTLFSVLCSLAYLATGRLATSIVMHALFNLSGVLMILLLAP